MPDRRLTRLFMQRFIENDLISPDADRLQVLSQTAAVLLTGALFVSLLLSLPYLDSPYPLPSRTAANMIRVQFLYSAWSMTVMALVAVSLWDALALDHRDTEILGPLPLRRPVIIRAKVSALVLFASGFAAALNVVPAMIHPVAALSRLRPSLLDVSTLMLAHLVSTTAAAAFGFATVLAVRELLHAALGTAAFRRVAVVVRAGLVLALVTTLLLVPAMAFKIANLWLLGAIDTKVLPPMWFVGLHDAMSGHIWQQLARPNLPPAVALSEQRFESLYQTHRPLLHELGVTGGATFLLVLLVAALAYVWNNRRLPVPPVSTPAQRSHLQRFSEAMALRTVARLPIVRAGLFFTVRVLGRSVQNRLSIGVPLAVALAVAMVLLPAAGLSSALDFSVAPVAVLAIQLLFVIAIAAGFRQSIRVPADLRARWTFHLIRPANHSGYLRGVKRAAVLRLVLPVLLGLLPFHVLALGTRAAMIHFLFGLLSALVLNEAFLLDYRRWPFAASYVPEAKITTHGGIYAAICFIGVYTVASLEHSALSTTTGSIALVATTAVIFAGVRAFDTWLRQDAHDVELDELVEPPTLRLGLSD